MLAGQLSLQYEPLSGLGDEDGSTISRADERGLGRIGNSTESWNRVGVAREEHEPRMAARRWHHGQVMQQEKLDRGGRIRDQDAGISNSDQLKRRA